MIGPTHSASGPMTSAKTADRTMTGLDGQRSRSDARSACRKAAITATEPSTTTGQAQPPEDGRRQQLPADIAGRRGRRHQQPPGHEGDDRHEAGGEPDERRPVGPCGAQIEATCHSVCATR